MSCYNQRVEIGEFTTRKLNEVVLDQLKSMKADNDERINKFNGKIEEQEIDAYEMFDTIDQLFKDIEKLSLEIVAFESDMICEGVTKEMSDTIAQQIKLRKESLDMNDYLLTKSFIDMRTKRRELVDTKTSKLREELYYIKAKSLLKRSLM